MGEREVGVERQPVVHVVEVGQLDAVAPARARSARSCPRRRRRAARSRGRATRSRAWSGVPARRWCARRSRRRRCAPAGRPSRSTRDAAGVVAVEAQAAAQIELRIGPRAEDQAALRADDHVVHLPGLVGVDAVDVEVEVVDAHAGHAAQPRRPLEAVLEVRRQRQLPDVVLARGGRDRVDLGRGAGGGCGVLLVRLRFTVWNRPFSMLSLRTWNPTSFSIGRSSSAPKKV